jgi:hypothetical protein
MLSLYYPLIDLLVINFEKLKYLSKNFNFLNWEGKEYLENVARQLLYIQYPVVRPLTVKKIRKNSEYREEPRTSGREL